MKRGKKLTALLGVFILAAGVYVLLRQIDWDQEEADGAEEIVLADKATEDMQQLQREVTFEPALALLGGKDGLDFYRQITAVWKHALKKGGWLLFEVGMGQHEDVEKILHSHGFDAVSSVRDLAGIFRVVMGKRSV